MSKFTNVALAALLTVGIAGGALAGVIEDRQKGFKAHGANIKAANEAIEAGNATGAVEPAKAMAAWAAKIPSMFPEGTGMGGGNAENAALPTIWTDHAGFEKAAMENKKAAEHLAMVAATGDAAAAGAALKALGRTCGGCHKAYREKKN